MPKMEINTHGYFAGYRTVVTIKHDGKPIKFDTDKGWNITGEITSTDNGESTDNSISISNVAHKHQALIGMNDPIQVETGPTDLFGTLVNGEVSNTQVTQDVLDSTMTVSFEEARGYVEAGKVFNKFNGTKTVTKTTKTPSGKTLKVKKKQVKKLNIAFKKGSTAKQIITRICSESNFKLRKLKLKNNLIYKKGYTLSQKPYQALQSIVKDCGSLLYIREGKLIIDDLTEPNPFNEHIFFSFDSGLLQEPTIDSKSGKTPMVTVDTLEDPRIKAGSVIYVKSHQLDTLLRVQSVKHTFGDDGYTMEAICYGEITAS